MPEGVGYDKPLTEIGANLWRQYKDQGDAKFKQVVANEPGLFEKIAESKESQMMVWLDVAGPMPEGVTIPQKEANAMLGSPMAQEFQRTVIPYEYNIVDDKGVSVRVKNEEKAKKEKEDLALQAQQILESAGTPEQWGQEFPDLPYPQLPGRRVEVAPEYLGPPPSDPSLPSLPELPPEPDRNIRQLGPGEQIPQDILPGGIRRI